jgi:hypothetical protein
MVNAWSLAASVLDGTLDEDYPMYGPEDEQALVERNKKKFPATDYTTGIFEYPDDLRDGEGIYYGDNYGYEYTHIDSGEPFKQDFLADNDDQAAHHFNLNNEVQQSKNMANYFKYHEEEILKDIEEYVSATYRGHYTGDTHEYRNVQTIDLMAARSLASGFCQSNILKYGSRYGSKDGRNKKDLLKVIHYAMLLLHFDDHYGKPSITTGNIDHNMP